jgi:hypothetical protein
MNPSKAYVLSAEVFVPVEPTAEASKAYVLSAEVFVPVEPTAEALNV